MGALRTKSWLVERAPCPPPTPPLLLSSLLFCSVSNRVSLSDYTVTESARRTQWTILTNGLYLNGRGRVGGRAGSQVNFTFPCKLFTFINVLLYLFFQVAKREEAIHKLKIEKLALQEQQQKAEDNVRAPGWNINSRCCFPFTCQPFTCHWICGT